MQKVQVESYLFALVKSHNASYCHPQHDRVKEENQAKHSQCSHQLHCGVPDIASAKRKKECR